jgi:hypothetical protein
MGPWRPINKNKIRPRKKMTGGFSFMKKIEYKKWQHFNPKKGSTGNKTVKRH